MLTLEDVEKIARLARLELTEREKNRFRTQLSEVLDYVEHIKELDTSEIPPTSTVLLARGTLRPDVPRRGLSLVKLLRNAPDDQDDQFRVPPVLE